MEIIKSTDESIHNSVVEITESNIDSLIANNELVLMVFCSKNPSSTRFVRIFEEVAKKITEDGINNGQVVLAKVDCLKEEAIANRFQLCCCYPIIMLFRNGEMSRHLFRCKRTVDGFVEFIKQQMSDPIAVINSSEELRDLSENKGHIVAYMSSKDQPEYDILRKVAMSLREKCQFYVIFGEATDRSHLICQLSVVFRSTGGTTVELDDRYNGSMLNYTEVFTWVNQRIFPLLREITPDNEENEKRNHYSISLILLHHPSDIESVKQFKEVISKDFPPKDHLVTLLADGRHLDLLMLRFRKSATDLPLIVFAKYSYVRFFDYNIVTEPGKLIKTIEDAKNGSIDQNYIYVGRFTSIDAEDKERIFELFE